MISLSLVRCIKLYADCNQELRDNNELVKDLYFSIDSAIAMLFEALKQKECHRAWTKLEAYFDMLYEIGASSVTAAQWILDRTDAISDLIDFLLGNKSPRAVHETEKRVIMGGTIVPPFSPIYNLIATLIRMTYTSKMDFELRLPTHSQINLITENESHKTYFLTEEA